MASTGQACFRPVVVQDLNERSVDPLLFEMRQDLNQKYIVISDDTEQQVSRSLGAEVQMLDAPRAEKRIGPVRALSLDDVAAEIGLQISTGFNQPNQSLVVLLELWGDRKLFRFAYVSWLCRRNTSVMSIQEPDRVTRQELMKPETFTTSKLQSLRGYNANFAVTVADGTVYLPMAGGITASGDSIEDHYNCRKIFDELQYCQEQVVFNVLAIRSALNLLDARKLTVHMAFDNRVCCFYEPTKGARLGGFTGLLIDE